MTASAPAATITTSVTTLTGFSTTTGTPSVAQTYTVGGTTLTTAITATAPTGYEVALESTTTPGTPGTFATSVNTAAPTSGTVAATTIYVRLLGTAVGTPSGDVVNTSTGATNKNVAVTGTVNAPAAPSVTTTAVTGVSTTTATSGGNVTASGGATITARGVVYGTTANPRIGDAGVTQLADGSPGTGAFSSSLTGLAPGTPYFVAAYATNSVGTTYGNDRTFTTPAAATAPSITTTAASAITSTTATSGGNVTTDGGDAVTARGIVYGTAASPRIGNVGVTQVTATGTTGTFSSSLTGLAPGTPYFVAAYATNSVGTTYGTDQTFTTLAPATAPSVTTTAVSAITATTATSGGNLTASGGATITARGVVYGTSPNPQIGGAGVTQVANGSPGTGTFTSSLTGLSGGTTYYVAAYATNSVGTTYGTDQTFATPAAPLLFYDFASSASPTTSNPNVTGSAFSRTGVSSNAGSNRFNSTGWSSATPIDETKYISFTFAPNAGYVADLTSLTFTDQRSATGAASPYMVRASTDATFATFTTLLTGTTTGGSKSAPLSFTGINASSTVYFRFYYANSGTYSVTNVNVFGTVTPDTTPSIAASPATLTFSAITGQVAATSPYTLSAANLAANAPISINSSDPAVLVSLTGGAPFAQTATTTTSATGSLSQVVTVQFTAPASAGNTAATITNTNGTITATVAVTGTATAPPAPTITSFTPINGPEGTVVTLTGTGYVAGTSVSFNGTAATAVTVVSATSIQATVPLGATTGTISVSNANGSATSTGIFTVTAPAGPVLAAGVLLLEDDFNYTAGTKLSTNGWATHSGASSNDQPAVVAGNLTKTAYPTGPLAPNANQVLVNNTGADVNKGFTVPAGQNTVYFSTLLNIPVGGTFPDYFLHLLERTNAAGTTTQNFRAKLFARTGATANTFNLGVSVTSNSGATPAPTYTTTEYAEGTTYLAVVKYVYTPGGSDVVALFVFDNATALPSAEPTTPAAGPLSETNNAAFSVPNAIAIRQTTTSPVVNLDGVRVATGWGTVVGNAAYTEATATISAGNYYSVALNNAGILNPTGAVNIEQTLDLTSGKINTSATNSLTLYQTATVSGGNNTSFVNGPVLRPLDIIAIRPTPVSFTFPVGQGNFYRPITLNLTEHKAASLYTATQTEGNPTRNLAPGNGLGTAPLARVSSKRFYTVTSSNTDPGNFTGTITLSFGAEDYVNVPSSTDFVIAKRDATGSFANQWTNLGRSANTGTDSGAGGPSVVGTLTSASFSDFSDFVLGAQNDLSNTNVLEATNPLPVELTAFSAQRQADKAVAVKWATATEKNSARFEVQRSLNGREFAAIATVAAQGTSTQPTAYAILDKTAPATMLYYRLRQVDLDGTSTLSPVVTVTGSGATAKVQLYPNPAHSRISFIAEAATPYRVLNQLGQPLLRGTTEAGTASIGLEALPTGLYFLELQTATGRTVQKFEKD